MAPYQILASPGPPSVLDFVALVLLYAVLKCLLLYASGRLWANRTAIVFVATTIELAYLYGVPMPDSQSGSAALFSRSTSLMLMFFGIRTYFIVYIGAVLSLLLISAGSLPLLSKIQAVSILFAAVIIAMIGLVISKWGFVASTALAGNAIFLGASCIICQRGPPNQL